MRAKEPQVLSAIRDDHELRRTEDEPAGGQRRLGHKVHAGEFDVGQVVASLLREQRRVGDGFHKDGRRRIAWWAVPARVSQGQQQGGKDAVVQMVSATSFPAPGTPLDGDSQKDKPRSLPLSDLTRQTGCETLIHDLFLPIIIREPNEPFPCVIHTRIHVLLLGGLEDVRRVDPAAGDAHDRLLEGTGDRLPDRGPLVRRHGRRRRRTPSPARRVNVDRHRSGSAGAGRSSWVISRRTTGSGIHGFRRSLTGLPAVGEAGWKEARGRTWRKEEVRISKQGNTHGQNGLAGSSALPLFRWSAIERQSPIKPAINGRLTSTN